VNPDHLLPLPELIGRLGVLIDEGINVDDPARRVRTSLRRRPFEQTSLLKP